MNSIFEQPQQSFNNKLIAGLLESEPHKDLPEELLRFLIDNIDNPQSFSLLLRYIRGNSSNRLNDFIYLLNFDFAVRSESYDVCETLKRKIEELMGGNDKVISQNEQDQIRALFKVIKDSSVQ